MATLKKPIDAKAVMLNHSEAKVGFYINYLDRYLNILLNTPFIEEVNIFDVFCGTGIYENGKKGSPIAAFDNIKKIRDKGKTKTAVNLYVNDYENEKVELVKHYIDPKNVNYCHVEYHNRTADEMFKYIKTKTASQKSSSRNLIFIDPYGYKEINKETLQLLLSSNRTEIILFLPISQMQRFTSYALTTSDDMKPYEPLKNFVYSFFEGDHPIKTEKVHALEYIDYLKEALKFRKKYYATSYFIQRDNSSYYGLFFVSPHIYGFEKILEVKWALDEDGGRGFKQPVLQQSLFHQMDKEETRNGNYSKLELVLKDSLVSTKTNRELYEIVLSSGFLPKHANEILENWTKNGTRLNRIDVEPGLKAGSYYINWDAYKKPAKVKYTYK